MKTIQELFQQIATGELQVADVETIQTDGGEIVRVHVESMNHPDVLGIIISLPGEVRTNYNLTA